jgi:hypothetical protein
LEGCTNTSIFEVDIHDPREVEINGKLVGDDYMEIIF